MQAITPQFQSYVERTDKAYADAVATGTHIVVKPGDRIPFAGVDVADCPWPAHAVVSTADALYAFGGTGAGGRPVLEVEMFDGHLWSTVSAIPGEGLNAPAAAFVNGSIYRKA